MTYSPRPKRTEAGEQAERAAERFLQARGLRTRQRNYRCKAGEIDLVMSEADTLVFVEVRLRRSTRFASAAETVDYRKQQKLIRAAQHYLQRTGLTDRVACRFDVVAFDPKRVDQETVNWVQNAFSTL
ncbi:YraN family protein [Marinimicrobium locisalis]|uniref:YraN family protein n=1 Tax=Marinimicrobium locisalis TaxID=546022 RepID=UPI003221B5D4